MSGIMSGSLSEVRRRSLMSEMGIGTRGEMFTDLASENKSPSRGFCSGGKVLCRDR